MARDKNRYKKASGGYRKLPDPTVPSGSDVAGQAMSSAAAGASAGSAFGPIGGAIGGVVGGIAGWGMARGQKEKAQRQADITNETNENIENASERHGNVASIEGKQRTAMAEDGLQGPVDDSAVEFEGIEGEGREIHGEPEYDGSGALIGFKIKNVAPGISHEDADSESGENLIPTEKGIINGTAPANSLDKEPISDNDVILPTQDLGDYEMVKDLIREINAGNRESGVKLNKIINKLPTDDMANKKYRNGVDMANTVGKYASAAHNLIRGTEEIDGVTRRNIKSKKQKYVRDTAKEERDILESRNAATQSMKGKALSAGQANAYASNIQRNADKAKDSVNARERAIERGIDAQNIERENRDQLTNLQLDNQYDATERQQDANTDEYTDVGMKAISEHAMVNETDKYKRSLDAKKEAREQEILDKGLIGKGTYHYYDDETGDVKFSQKRNGLKGKSKRYR